MNDSPPSLHEDNATAAQLLRSALAGGDHDYTRLPLRRAVFLLALPMVMEMAMESLFAVADIFWVSRLGADAVATVGLTEGLLALVYSLAFGVSLAATASVARRVGAGELGDARATAGQVLLLAAGMSALIGVVGWLCAKPVLALMGASPAVIELGRDYTRIMLGGSVTVVLLFAQNAIFRGAGDASIAMRSLWLANIANIALGPLFIFGLGLGVRGAAIATTLGRGIGVLYQLQRLFGRSGRLQLELAHLRPAPPLLTSLARLSVSGTLQTLLETCSWLGLVRILARFGSVALAGYTIAMRVAIFALLPAFGFANAAATLVGQNLGANKPERAEQAVWRVAFYNFVFLGVAGLVFSLAPEPILRLFSADPAELAYAVSCLRTVALGFLFYAYGMVLVQAFNGAGDARTPTLLNFVCFWCFKIPLAYLLAVVWGLGPRGVFIAITCAYSLSAALALWLFRAGRWKTQRA